ncbi:MAG: hypothetical protein EFKGCFLK_01116 [Rhodocyclaceae bacterium]|nr:MAG: hypothetical protein F9K21_13550 [Rhodocyclaceae bacterium]MBV6407549.1 hypothetical protein [Rhodocyclaceae bacterium]CAG0934104.1 hypothetical protein RHDC3_02809 [Rhodocyclaceae bacterium]
MDDEKTPETRWRRAREEFERETDVGALLFFLGLIAVLPAIGLIRESIVAAAMAVSAALGLIVYGYIRNVRLARKHLKCPRCGHYPFGKSLLTARHPVFVINEVFFRRRCWHCDGWLEPGNTAGDVSER